MTAIPFTVEDVKDPTRLERLLRQVTSVMAQPVPFSKLPSASDIANQIAPLIRNQLQANGSAPLNLQGLLPVSSTASVTEDTHAKRLSSIYTPPKGAGLLFIETDRSVLYASELVSGALKWVYTSGVFVAAFASRPADLTSNDTGFQFYATDQDTVYIWTGAAWDTISRRILLGGFFAIFTHANSADRTYTFPDATGNIVYETASLTNHAIVLGGGGALAKAGTLGTTTTVLHGNAAGDPAYSAVDLVNDVTGTLTAGNGGTGITYNRISDTVALTNQAADIAATALANSSTVGTYRVSYYLEDTTADVAAGAVTATFAFTDSAGATTVVSASVPLTGIGTLRTSGVFFIQLASGNITYAVSHTGIFGTAKYALYICLERLS